MSETCDEMLKLSGNYWPYRLSMVYRYTGSLPNLITGSHGSMDRSLKGWKPLDGTLDTTGVKAEEYPYPISSEKAQLMKRFIQDCKSKDIKLFITVSPMYICSQEDIYRFPKELAQANGIPIIDHFRDSAYVGHAELFYDFGHLNRQGAEKFSKQLCNELKERLRADNL